MGILWRVSVEEGASPSETRSPENRASSLTL